jgi:CDP-diacylglycerol--glycerol-3-phosphate 3-phosphatidyltransferase
MAKLANRITLLRIILAPFVVAAILSGRNVWALWLFVAAALTDYLDGVVARQFGEVTKAGAYFDPIADKFLMACTLLALVGASGMPWWFAVVVVGNGVYILACAGVLIARKRQDEFPPSMWGKASMFAQFIAVAAWIAHGTLRFQAFHSTTLVMGMLWIAAVLTAWSAIHYTYQWCNVDFQRRLLA